MIKTNSLQPLGEATRQHGLLDEMSDNLLLAITPQQQLEAVMSYPVLHRSTAARLYYVNSDDPNMVTLIAEWVSSPASPLGVGSVAPLDDSWSPTPNSHASFLLPRLVNDTSTFDVPQHIHDAFMQNSISAMVNLPISNQGEWIGMIVFTWSTPQNFTDQDRLIYTRMIQISTAAIHVVRLLERSRQRSQELEIVNKELDLLYRASEAINIADTYQELIEAVAEFDPLADMVTLILWDNFDWATAEFGTTVAVIDRRNAGTLKVGDQLPTAGFPIGNTMLGERVWIYEDAHTDPRIDPITAQSWELLNIRAFLGPALYKGESWMGGITYHTSYPRHYTQREARLLATIGDLVAAAVQRIHLQQERERSRHRAEMLARINALLLQAKNDVDIVAAIATYTAWLNIYGMSLVYIDTDPITKERTWRPVAVWHEDQAHIFDAEVFPEVRYISSEITALWTHNPYEILVVENVLEDERFSDNTRENYLTHLPIRSFVLIPLVIGEKYYGVLRITWVTPRKFDEFELSMFQSFLRILPFVVATRRNYLAEQQRANELEVIARVSAAAANIMDESNLLQTICELANQQFEEYTIVVFLLDEHQKKLDWFIHSELESIAISDTTSPAAYVARERNSLIINDVVNTPEYVLVPIRYEVRSIMALPIIAGDQFIGVLEIQCTKLNRFSSDDLRVMETLSDLIAVAVRNARLYQQSLSYAVLEERNRLARELHDSVSQAMYGIALGARTARTMLDRDITKLAEPLDYVLQLSEAGLAEMRALIFELRPETLEKEGLVEAISRQVTMLQARHGISVQLAVQDEPYLKFKIKEAIYWIVREALHNIVKHARATDVTIQLDCTDNTLVLKVQDNGIGFDPNAEFKGHIGLQTMHERCRQIGGTLTIDSEIAKGSTLSLSVPLA